MPERRAPPEEQVRWLSEEEAEHLIAACSDRFRPLVIFLLYTGARRSLVEGELFRRCDGQPYEWPEANREHAEHILAGSRISTAFAGACRRTKITGVHPHDCRHT